MVNLNFSEKIPEPYLSVLKIGGSVDYSTEPGENDDHHFVERLGYTIKMYGDCSMSAPGLKGISLSSYGNWGSVYGDWLDEKSVKVVNDMFEQGVIWFWRCRFYIDNYSYTYDNNYGWQRYDDNKRDGWEPCDQPDFNLN